MTKNDLRNGMVGEQRNGNRKLVVGGILIGEDDWDILDDYYDDLVSMGDKPPYGDYEEFDIVKVYEIHEIKDGNINDDDIGSLSNLAPKDNFDSLSEEYLMWSRSETEVERANTNNELAVETTKDIASGMIVETREGVRYLVLDDLLIGEDYWNELSDYEDNLNMIGQHREFDIVKVYNPDKCLGGQRLPKNNFSNLNEEFLVWSRADGDPKTEPEVNIESLSRLLAITMGSLSEEELKEISEQGEITFKWKPTN